MALSGGAVPVELLLAARLRKTALEAGDRLASTATPSSMSTRTVSFGLREVVSRTNAG